MSDVSTQNWHSEINNSSKLRTYCQFESVLEIEKYLMILDIFKFRKALTNFRISCHSLRMQTGRYGNTLIHERICHFCFQNNRLLIDNEYHLIMECEQLNGIRNTSIRDYTLYTNFSTSSDLLKTSNTYKLKQLSQFLLNVISVKKNIAIKLLAEMRINCNALHYGPMVPSQNKLTYLLT